MQIVGVVFEHVKTLYWQHDITNENSPPKLLKSGNFCQYYLDENEF